MTAFAVRWQDKRGGQRREAYLDMYSSNEMEVLVQCHPPSVVLIFGGLTEWYAYNVWLQ